MISSTPDIKPLFIFSMPRSGSTLLQRLLASHEKISTAMEPWILLPYLYTLKEKGVYSEYGHFFLTQAVDSFCDELPNGQDDYFAEMRSFILRLYSKVADKNAKYFLDKTPRYYLIAEDIFRLFPEGKFVFLWRNPLAIVASILDTWEQGKWKLYRHKIDIFDGLVNLVNAYEKYGNQAYSLQYEALVSNPIAELQQLFAYLELPFDPVSNTQPIELENQLLGDSTGVKQYKSISKEPISEWKLTMTNSIRKSWCRQYLHWIGKERLAVMGYSLDEILTELATIPFNSHLILEDLLLIPYGALYCAVEPTLIKHKIQILPNFQKLHTHT
ncbi:sulfotransferase family protein [Coleofasciculus sp. F4-SAH-05]|uniref:sulfotransferase family protein n=1 Tax=Coleofasciculus sp. F4-SAH-05 TaxID=3069525 RepID=UPI0032F8A6A0